MKLFSLILFAVLLTGYNSYAQNYFPATGNVGIGTTNPYGPLNVDPQGTGGITIGNPSVNSGGFTSLQMGISAVQNGYSFIQGIQASGVTWGNIILNKGGGNVGIGTTTPLSLLQVNGNIAAKAAADANNSYLLFQRSSDGYVGARLGNSYAFSGYGGHLVFETNDGGGPTSLVERLRITNNGNVGIGITTPQNKLDVNGTIHSKAVNIDLNGWNDYVFKKDYQLRPLSEVKAYIDQNQHLPEIPSEQEMVKKGLDVGEMNKLLMKKVEELTLYLIEKDQKEKEQGQMLSKQQEQINKLTQQVEVLTKALSKN